MPLACQQKHPRAGQALRSIKKEVDFARDESNKAEAVKKLKGRQHSGYGQEPDNSPTWTQSYVIGDSARNAAKVGLIAARESASFTGRKSVGLGNIYSVNRMNLRPNLGPETCATSIQTPATLTISSIELTSNTLPTLKTILTPTTTSLLP